MSETTGYGVDERIGRLLGIVPKLSWGVGNRAEHSWTYYGNEWQCRDWFARHQKEYPEHAAGMEVYSIEVWPKYSTDLNACREAELELERRGLGTKYGTEVARMIKATRVLWTDVRDFDMLTADAETRCRAMLAALAEAK